MLLGEGVGLSCVAPRKFLAMPPTEVVYWMPDFCLVSTI